MAELSFVNIFGQPVDTTPKKRTREKRESQAHHDGWLAMGISPTAMARFTKEAQQPGVLMEDLLRNAKLEKIRAKPFFSAFAAREACDLAQKYGWYACRVVEKREE